MIFQCNDTKFLLLSPTTRQVRNHLITAHSRINPDIGEQGGTACCRSVASNNLSKLLFECYSASYEFAPICQRLTPTTQRNDPKCLLHEGSNGVCASSCAQAAHSNAFGVQPLETFVSVLSS